eukprot:5325382-Amphidinium_carterae.1
MGLASIGRISPSHTNQSLATGAQLCVMSGCSAKTGINQAIQVFQRVSQLVERLQRMLTILSTMFSTVWQVLSQSIPLAQKL